MENNDSTNPLDHINEVLGLDLWPTGAGDEYKGRKIDPDCVGGVTCKFYINREDCLRLAEAFAEIAKNLK
jgi:hypothetical protein